MGRELADREVVDMVEMKRRRRDPRRLRELRQVIQLVFLFILSLLLIGTASGRATRSGTPLIAFSAAAVVLSLTLGRVWCSWACPVNTLLERIHFKDAMIRGGRIPDRWRLLKYLLLVMGIATIPFLIADLQPGALALHPREALNPAVLVWAAVGLLMIVGLEYFAERFWCRYLCPLGGAVALLAKAAPMRRIVRAHCNECAICVDSCPVGIIDPRQGFTNARGECTVCLDCLAVCASGSNGFSFRDPRPDRVNSVISAHELKAVQQ
jgi:polyferredoxin